MAGAKGGSLSAAPIQIRRLCLEPLAPPHVGELSRLLSDPTLHQYIDRVDQKSLEGALRRRIRGCPDAGVSWCNWALRLLTEDRLVGTVQATVTSAPDGLDAEVAWVVATAWQGQGLAKEAATALVGWLRQAGVHSLLAWIHPGNRASQDVARAIDLLPTDEWLGGEVGWRS